MNTTEYLRNCSWKLYRTRFEGKAAQWVSPCDNKVYSQPDAVKIEKSRMSTTTRSRWSPPKLRELKNVFTLREQ